MVHFFGLEKTVSELSAKRATQDPRFKQYFDSRFDAYMNTSNIPSIDEIEQRRHRVGSYDIIYNEYLHEIRTQLTHQFFLLDDALESPMEDIKQKVALVLAEQGRLRHMTTTEGSRFFTTVAEKIPVDRKKLKEVFQAFATFRLSYRGFFQYRIRMNLDALTPDRTAYRFAPVNSTNNDRRQPANAAPNQPNMTNARQVQNGLATIQKQTVAELRKTLNDYLVEPSQAAFAITEEFVDQLLRAKDARDDLAAFYRDVHIEVWPDEFRNIYTWQQLQRQWRTLIDEANSFNELSNSRFSN